MANKTPPLLMHERIVEARSETMRLLDKANDEHTLARDMAREIAQRIAPDDLPKQRGLRLALDSALRQYYQPDINLRLAWLNYLDSLSE